MYIYHCPCFQSIQFTWKQVGYLASKMMLHRILHLLYFAILTQYFCSLCDISKTVFVIKWDYFDLHYRCYFSWCMLRLFVMKKGCVSYMFLWWICFWRKAKNKALFFWKMHNNVNFSLIIVSRGKMFQQLLLMVIRYL